MRYLDILEAHDIERVKRNIEEATMVTNKSSDLVNMITSIFDDWKSRKHNEQEIAELLAAMGYRIKMDGERAELIKEAPGDIRKFLAGAAIIASLWGVNNHVAQQAYENSPQLQKLTALHQEAEAQGNERAADNYADRIEQHKLRLDLGKGEVMGTDGSPKEVKPFGEEGVFSNIKNANESPAGLQKIYDNGGKQDVQYTFRFKSNHNYDTSAIGRNKLVRISVDGKHIAVVADSPRDAQRTAFYVDAIGKEITWRDVPKAVKSALLKRLHGSNNMESVEVEQVDEAKVDRKTLDGYIRAYATLTDPEYGHYNDERNLDKKIDNVLKKIEKLAGKKVRDEVSRGGYLFHYPRHNFGQTDDAMQYRQPMRRNKSQKGRTKASKSDKQLWQTYIKHARGDHKLKGKLPEEVEQFDEATINNKEIKKIVDKYKATIERGGLEFAKPLDMNRIAKAVQDRDTSNISVLLFRDVIDPTTGKKPRSGHVGVISTNAKNELLDLEKGQTVDPKEIKNIVAKFKREIERGGLKFDKPLDIDRIVNTVQTDDRDLNLSGLLSRDIIDPMTNRRPTGGFLNDIVYNAKTKLLGLAYRKEEEVEQVEESYDDDDAFFEAYGWVEENLEEAEYQGRKVKLNKPMQGDVKKFKVYVKDPKTGNVKKVNFGHGGSSVKGKAMKIRKNNPKARKSFRARHNCDNPGSKLKARYWSCRKW